MLRLFALTFAFLLTIAAAAAYFFFWEPETEVEGYRFIAFGDAPYGNPEEVFPQYEKLIANINDRNPDLVIHLGDTQLPDCSDWLTDRLLEYMGAFQAPVLYTMGDNEWTDCRAPGDPNFPLERLDYLRATHFKGRSTTLGAKPITVQTQEAEGYPENLRLMRDNVAFITAHVVGSHNNYNPSDPSAIAEFEARSDANLKWLKSGFETLADAKAFVVVIHADIFFPKSGYNSDLKWKDGSPYKQFGDALRELSVSSGKPVLLLYGDSHEHLVFHPNVKEVPNLTAIEVHGFPDMKALEIEVRPNAEQPFLVTRIINSKTLGLF